MQNPPTDSSRDPSHPPDKKPVHWAGSGNRNPPPAGIPCHETGNVPCRSGHSGSGNVAWRPVRSCAAVPSGSIPQQFTYRLPVLSLTKSSLNAFSMIGPFPFRVAALSSNSRESRCFHQIRHRNPGCIHSYAAKFSSYPHLLPE